MKEQGATCLQIVFVKICPVRGHGIGRKGLFGVDSRRVCARKCKYCTHPCALAHGQRVS